MGQTRFRALALLVPLLGLQLGCGSESSEALPPEGSSARDGGTGGSGGLLNTDSGASGSSDGSVADVCIEEKLAVEALKPNVALLIDQSGSMTENMGGVTRWNAVQEALLDPTTGVVATMEGEVRFGLALYTSFGGNAGGACPRLTTVSFDLGNYAEIKAAYESANPAQDTPTGESLAIVADSLLAYPEAGPRAIVLATDGEPDTCEDANTTDTSKSLEAAADAFDKGIRTFIISVGTGVGVQHLQQMANVGQGLPATGAQNAQYYQAVDQQELANAFNTVVGGVKSCVLKLGGQVDAGAEGQGKVLLDGQSLPYNGPNGWRLNSPTELELLGDACAAIQEGEHEVAVTFPCGTVQYPR